MQHIQGGDRNQTLLLPAAVDDYVGRENPVRLIEAFVDQCDLQEAGFRRGAFSRRTRAGRATRRRLSTASLARATGRVVMTPSQISGKP